MNKVMLTRLPASMHNHARQGLLMRMIVGQSCHLVGYEAQEPNTDPPVVSTSDAIHYRRAIRGEAARAMAPKTYHPIFGVYVTKDSNPADVAAGFTDGDIGFIKWYPPHGTTNSRFSIPILDPVYCRMAEMAAQKRIPFQHHGELTHDDCGNEEDHQDRERRFYETAFPEIRRRWPEMRYMGEHLTTEEGVTAILNDEGCGGTVTPWHIHEDRRIVNRGGMNPLYAIMPALKRERHKLALRAAIKKRNPRLFAGPDQAAHSLDKKSRPVGCACGIYSPWWIEWYVTVFEEMGILDYLEEFLCINGPRHYGLEPIPGTVILEKHDIPRYPEPVRFGKRKEDVVIPYGYHPDPNAEALGLRKPMFWTARRVLVEG